VASRVDPPGSTHAHMVMLKLAWSNFLVLERAWSNLIVRSAVPTPPPDDELPSTDPRRRTRVTPQLRAEIVRRYQAGEPSRLVAEELEIGKATVLKVLKSAGVKLKPTGGHY
jgi:hypothetical protein